MMAGRLLGNEAAVKPSTDMIDSRHSITARAEDSDMHMLKYDGNVSTDPFEHNI